MNRVFKLLSVLAALVFAKLAIALQVANSKKASAEARADQERDRADMAEERNKRQEALTSAMDKAKQEGSKHVEQAVDSARTGDRSHFE